MRIYLTFLTVIVIFLSGCAPSKSQTAQVAETNAFLQNTIATGTFNLTSYQKVNKIGGPVNIYVEGDGYAWVSKSRISADPSPRTPIVMRLAALDPNPNVVYLARPCQFSPQDLTSVCDSKYWSSARYAPIVIQAIDNAVTQIKKQTQAKQINLIGYSGGGALVVLVAAQRNDISSIRTIAGNLDLLTMEKFHNISPLDESVDPMTVATKIRHIPQLHFVGGKDKIVPVIVATNFVKATGLDKSRVIIIKNANHDNLWVKYWPKLLKSVP